MPDPNFEHDDDAFEKAYLETDEAEPQSPAELAAVRALAAYREARQAGRAVSIEELTRTAPHAANEIRAAIEAFDFINDAGSRATGTTVRTNFAPETFPRIAGYEILRVIGQGGMGVVYAAVQQSLQRPVAIKILAPHLESQTDVIARFVREIHLLTRLTHPNIVDIIDAGVTDLGRHYYVMEYIDGLSLERIVRKHRVRSHTAVAILKQIVAGLKAAHKQGILHRDLKPGNILLDRNAVVRIADFGLAAVAVNHREDDEPMTRTDGHLGTVGYMSPEQMSNASECDERSDIYAVGVIFYQMLTGQLPHGSFKPASELAPGLTSAADRLIEKCIRNDPDERYQTADQLLESVGKLERRITRTRRKLHRLLRHPELSGLEAEDVESAEVMDDPDLGLVIASWSRLPEALKIAILAIVRSSEAGKG